MAPTPAPLMTAGGAGFFSQENNMSKTRNRIASPATQRAIMRVVDYMAHDEWRSFNGEPDHIWYSVRTLRDWLGWDKFKNEDEETVALEEEYAFQQERTKASQSSTAA
jgi:hypothetical protein